MDEEHRSDITYTPPSDFEFTGTIPPETTYQKEEKENDDSDAEDSDSDQEDEVQPTPQLGFVSREEVVETSLTQARDASALLADTNALLTHMMKYMSTEMKWRNDDREREKKLKKKEKKKAQDDEKKREELENYRRTQATLSSFPKITDKQQLNMAIELLESMLNHNELPAHSWNYTLLTSLMGKYQELAVDIPCSVSEI